MPRVANKKKAANGYKLPESISVGELLEDVAKKKWRLGHSIGKGGFGEIYSAQEADTDSGEKYPFVVKIEPHENGPLFVEMHVYIKIAKPEDVEVFKKQKGLKTFGMPLYMGSGSHEYNGQKYRFIVMEKFGTDLMKIFTEHNRHFPTSTVFKIAIQILDVLEYIHSKGYVHADVKGANILMGVTKNTANKQVYLVDFGLATKCNEEEEFKPNPKKAHDGTIEYLSRDAHRGVYTKRGDLETLAYNLIQWFGCILPWESNLKDANAVQNLKEEYMASVPKFIKACFDKRSPPGPIVDFLNCLSTLEHNSSPDYKTIRKIFLSGLTSGDALGKPFQFVAPAKTPLKKSPAKRKNADPPAASSKRKQAKKDVKEVSEDEKENLDDLSDTEETEAKENGTNGTTTPKGKKTKNSARRTKKRLTEEFTDDDVPEVQNDSEDDDQDLDKDSVNEEVENTESTIKSKKTKVKQKRGRKKSAKGVTGKSSVQSEEDIVEDQSVPEAAAPPARTTRQRGRHVNYKEDSDDEQKPNRKKIKSGSSKSASAKELHVTGDSGDSSDEKSKQKKKSEKSKKKAVNKKTVSDKDETDDEFDSASNKDLGD